MDLSRCGCIIVAISVCGCVRMWCITVAISGCGCVRMWCSLWLYQGVDVSGCGCIIVAISVCGCVRMWCITVAISGCGCVRMWCITVAISGCGCVRVFENGFECFKVLRLHQSVWVLWLSPLSLRLCRMVDTLSSSSLSSLIHAVSHPFL